ncbi:general substrate transporter [Penicillium cataractarum]|uniref:General substrate transporter n=1 Tax=Penicillium cataractarum TaxID=2100454 RepID=A0A9W9VTB5_9EURO|nr:general substrate transporter [Penicillium cataractarum]KAJ5389006.1 general substrate transporter [Penicillium cataractarum]
MQLKMFGKGRTLRWAITFICEIAFIFFGYGQDVMCGLVTNVDLLRVLKNPSDSALGIMLSIYNLGCFTGCFINWVIGDGIGRRKAIYFAMGWIIIGATLQASAFSLARIMVGRFVTGIGTDIKTSTVPVYQSELCEASKPAFLDYGMVHVDGPLGWRLPIAFQLVFAFVVCFMTLGVPESPRYLYRKDRGEEAIQVLCDVYDKDPNRETIMREQADITEALQTERSAERFQWRNILKKDEKSKRENVLHAHCAPERRWSLTLDGGSSWRSNSFNLMFLIGSIFPTTMADRIGRRKPMMLGSLGCGLAMMCVSILLSFKDTSVSHQMSIGAVACFFLFMLFYGAAVQYPVEGLSHLHVPYFAFVPLVYFSYPETANLTLEEVDLLYAEHGTPARKVAERFQKQIKEHGRGIMYDIRTPAIKTDASHVEEVK